MQYRIKIAALFGLFLCSTSVQAADEWVCKINYDNDPKHKIEGPVGIESGEQLVYSGDFTSEPNRYDIIENTDAYVVAVSRKSPIVLIAIMDRERNIIKLYARSADGSYEESMSGICHSRQPD